MAGPVPERIGNQNQASVRVPRIPGVFHGLIVVSLLAGADIHAIEIKGSVDLRIGATDAERSWTRDGLDKTRFDRHSGAVRLGNAFLRADADVFDSISASIVASAADDRGGVFDINEAWVGWNPVPSSPWKTRMKFGAFFPATNLEIDYDSIGWTPARTISSSAINSWFGEELRTHGVELSVIRKGLAEGSSHDVGFTAALFNGNDPAGTLLAWRGWSMGDRISGLREPIRLADLPVYRGSGALPGQDRTIHLFRELDNRPGYYLGVHYAFEALLSVQAMHYDNRGNPLLLKNGQYSWKTRFDHLSVRLQPRGDWVLLFQALRGDTLMGPNAVRLRYDAGYALASHPLGPGQLTFRVDRFRTQEHVADVLQSDPNSETGRSLALAYAWPISPSVSIVSEILNVQSTRAARTLIGEVPDKRERSLTVAIRWQF